MIESTFDIGGAVVFWTAAEFTDRVRLDAGFRALGLDKFVPEPRPEAGILRDALEDVFGGSRILVRPLAHRDGFAVVQEDRGKADNAYATVLVLLLLTFTLNIVAVLVRAKIRRKMRAMH